MPEYLAPGVYVEESFSNASPIAGVSTSTAGFLGLTERGPEAVQFITSWIEFHRLYGSYIEQSYLAYAVQGFFDNGGRRCFIGRIVSESATASEANIDDLHIVAIGRGKWSDGKIEVRIDQSDQLPRDGNQLKVIVCFGDQQEMFTNVTLDSLPSVINRSSNLIRAWWKGGTPPSTLTLSAPDAKDPYGLVPTILGGGSDGAALTEADFEGREGLIPFRPKKLPPNQKDLLGRDSGLIAMSKIGEISLLIIPDEVQSEYGGDQLSKMAIQQCETLRDRFAIVSAPQSAGEVQSLMPVQDSKYAAFYYPWIKVFDPSANAVKLIPASGHIAGIYARTDSERGVHKAPADEVVRGALDLQMPITKGVQDLLNPRGVNCMRDFRSDGRGLRLWGARTMSSDPEWKYINVRRLFMFVEQSIDEGTRWAVFEPNDSATWAKVTRVVTSFLDSVWRSGGLMGNTPDEAFFVKCDRTTMTQDNIDSGRLICVIGIAPVKPAEFVIFRISQQTA